MPTTYELYNYSVAEHGIYDPRTIALREKLDSEIALANGNAQSLAGMLPYDAQIPKRRNADENASDGRMYATLDDYTIAHDMFVDDYVRASVIYGKQSGEAQSAIDAMRAGGFGGTTLEHAQMLANVEIKKNVQIPGKIDIESAEDSRTGKELIDAALAPDKTSTDAERVELFETFAEETLPTKKVKQATERYEEDISGVKNNNTPWMSRYGTVEDEESYWGGKYLSGGKLADLFDLLRTGEYAIGGILLRHRQRKDASVMERILGESAIGKTEAAMYGIKHRISPSAALEIEGFWAGLAADIFLDPTTYLSGGTAAVPKIGAKVAPKILAKLGVKAGGTVAIKKGGTEVLEAMVKSGRYSLDEAEKILIEWMLKHPDDATKWMHKGGLRWMGETIVHGKYFERAADVITGLPHIGKPVGQVGGVAARGYRYVEQLPFRAVRAAARPVVRASHLVSLPISHGVSRIADWTGRAFTLGYEQKRLGDMGVRYIRDYLDMVHRKKGAQAQAFHELKEMAGGYKKRGKEITKYIEEGVSTGDEAFDDFIESIVKPHAEKMRLGEVERGIDVGELTSYVPHVLTKLGKKRLKQFGSIPDVYTFYGQKVRAHYAEARDIPGTIEEINEQLSVKFFEGDYWKAVVQREQKHIEDVYTADWFKHVQKEYGIERPITDVKQVLKGYTDVPETLMLRADTGIDEFIEEEFERVSFPPFNIKDVSRIKPFEELRRITKELREELDIEKITAKTGVLPTASIKKFIGSEKTKLFKGTYKSSIRKVKELEDIVSTYRDVYGDAAKREEWIGAHRGVLSGMKIAPYESGAVEKYVSQEISRITHELTEIPIAKIAEERVLKTAEMRNVDELRKWEDEFIEKLGRPEMFTSLFTKKRGEPIYKEIVKRATSATEEGIDYTLAKHPQLREKLLPDKIAKHLEEMIESEPTTELGKALHGIGKVWGSAQTWFKRSVTTGFGPFLHTAFFGRNVLGGAFQNIMAGVAHPKAYARGMQARMGWETPEWASKLGLWPEKFKTFEFGEVSAKEIQDIARRGDIFGQPGMTDIEVEKLWHRTSYEFLRDLPGMAMAATEDFVRMPLFTKRLETMSAKQARDETFKYHFAYDPEFATKFENEIMKRVVTFYTWPRRSVPLAAEYTAQKPGLIGAVGKVRDRLFDYYGIRVADEDEDIPMPEPPSHELPPGFEALPGDAQAIVTSIKDQKRPLGTTADEAANLEDATRYVPVTRSPDGKVSQVFDIKEDRVIQLTEWQQNTYTIPNVFTGGEDLMVLDLPFTDLTMGTGDVFFALSPFIKAPIEYGRIESGYGSDEYKREQKWELAKSLFGQRYVKTAEKLEEKETTLEKALYMAGAPTYEFVEPKVREEAFEAMRWGEPRPTKEQEVEAWIMAGMPEGFRIKTIAGTAGGPRGVKEKKELSTFEWAKRKVLFWEDFPEEPEEPTGEFALLALTEDVYERARTFKLTEEEKQYVFTPAEIEPSGAREARYTELLEEWEEFKAGEATIEAAGKERLMESWRRAGEPEKYVQKIYRDEIGKLIGVSTYTPEEIEEMKGFRPSEAQLEWAFRETREILPKEQLKIWKEIEEEIGFRPTDAQMDWATTTDWLSVGGVRKEMTFDEQMEHFSKEHIAEQEQDRLMRKELIELREDPLGKTRSEKGVSVLLTDMQARQNINVRRDRMEEIEDLLGVGVDR